MIHYGKTPKGDLELHVSAEDIGEVYGLLETAGLLQRRTFNGLKDYVCTEFAEELASYRRRVSAQIPLAGEKGRRC